MNGRMARAAKVGVPSIAGLALVLLGGVSAPVATGQDADARQPVQQVDRTFAYTCTLPDGTVPVTLHAAATVPERGVVGRPVKATGATLAVTVPPVGLAGLPGATAATAVVRWDNVILSEGQDETTTWTTAVAEPVSVPVDADVVFAGPVDLPPFETRTAGDLELVASVLTVVVTGQTADGVATEPPTTELSCTLDEDQNAGVVVVSVAAATREPSPSTTPEQKQPDRGEAPLPPRFAAEDGEIPKECHKYEGIPAKFNSWFCAYLAGYANVNKLNASVLQPGGIQNIATAPFVFPCSDGPKPPLMLCLDARVLPDYEGEPKLPPAPASFRTFGFVPTTGTMQLTQLGPAETHSWSTIIPPYEGLTTIKVRLSVRILETAVNGVRVEVGPNCRSAKPIDAVLYGEYPEYSITEGGPIYGTIDVPPFSGCGVTEDLDPIISGLVSGPDNYVKMTQGAVCYFGNGSGVCPPPVPEPER